MLIYKMLCDTVHTVVLRSVQRYVPLTLVSKNYAWYICLFKITVYLFDKLSRAKAFGCENNSVEPAHADKRIDVFKSGYIAVKAQLTLSIQYPCEHYHIIPKSCSLRVDTLQKVIILRADYLRHK